MDESLISPKGWMALDSLSYLETTRSPPADVPREDILDLAIVDLAVVRLSRRDNDNRIRDERAAHVEGKGRIPTCDIIAIGGTNLEERSTDQPFWDESEVANDNLGRFLLLVVLLIAVVGGYALTAFGPDTRRAIEVTPPDSPAIRVSSPEQASHIET